MDVVVENLTKSFGYQKAVDSVSFEVKKGEILGFLGPNGAGQTTTLKIMSCFLFPDYGTIPRKPKQPAMQRRLYRFPCQWWRYAILLMGYYCRKLERAFRHLPQRRTLRCHVLLQGRADKETLRAVCRLS